MGRKYLPREVAYLAEAGTSDNPVRYHTLAYRGCQITAIIRTPHEHRSASLAAQRSACIVRSLSATSNPHMGRQGSVDLPGSVAAT